MFITLCKLCKKLGKPANNKNNSRKLIKNLDEGNINKTDIFHIKSKRIND